MAGQLLRSEVADQEGHQREHPHLGEELPRERRAHPEGPEQGRARGLAIPMGSTDAEEHHSGHHQAGPRRSPAGAGGPERGEADGVGSQDQRPAHRDVEGDRQHRADEERPNGPVGLEVAPGRRPDQEGDHPRGTSQAVAGGSRRGARVEADVGQQVGDGDDDAHHRDRHQEGHPGRLPGEVTGFFLFAGAEGLGEEGVEPQHQAHPQHGHREEDGVTESDTTLLDRSERGRVSGVHRGDPRLRELHHRQRGTQDQERPQLSDDSSSRFAHGGPSLARAAARCTAIAARPPSSPGALGVASW